MRTDGAGEIGCGAPNATWIIFRGKTKRGFLGNCCLEQYEGGGRVLPYETGEDVPENRVSGRFIGVARKCGEETL